MAGNAALGERGRLVRTLLEKKLIASARHNCQLGAQIGLQFLSCSRELEEADVKWGYKWDLQGELW